MQEDDPENADETAKKKLTVEEKAIFLEGDALQIEMGNIVMRTTTGNIALYDVARASQHKDRYSEFLHKNTCSTAAIILISSEYYDYRTLCTAGATNY